jgi:hypothetical protein
MSLMAKCKTAEPLWYRLDHFSRIFYTDNLKSRLCTFMIDRRCSHETDLSTQQSEAEPEIRVPGEDENPGRTAYFKAPPGEGSA